MSLVNYMIHLWNRCKIVHQQFGALKIRKCVIKCMHENAMRFYLGVHKFTTLPALYGEMGWIAVK